MSEEKKFCDMTALEKLADLRERVTQFSTLQLPGQIPMMHMGTSYLVNDLWTTLREETIVIQVLSEEGGEWQDFERNKFEAVHAIRFANGAEWDCRTGWR